MKHTQEIDGERSVWNTLLRMDGWMDDHGIHIKLTCVCLTVLRHLWLVHSCICWCWDYSLSTGEQLLWKSTWWKSQIICCTPFEDTTYWIQSNQPDYTTPVQIVWVLSGCLGFEIMSVAELRISAACLIMNHFQWNHRSTITSMQSIWRNAVKGFQVFSAACTTNKI